MDLRLKTASHLSPEEQKFLAEETTHHQVVQDQASAAAMVEAEKAKAAGMGRGSGAVAGRCRKGAPGREARGRGKSSGAG